MTYQLVPALMEDQVWLERLRRDVYLELFVATFGSWDEVRHARQFSECLTRGGISIIKIDGMRVGMIQFLTNKMGSKLVRSRYSQVTKTGGLALERFDGCGYSRAWSKGRKYCFLSL